MMLALEVDRQSLCLCFPRRTCPPGSCHCRPGSRRTCSFDHCSSEMVEATRRPPQAPAHSRQGVLPQGSSGECDVRHVIRRIIPTHTSTFTLHAHAHLFIFLCATFQRQQPPIAMQPQQTGSAGRFRSGWWCLERGSELDHAFKDGGGGGLWGMWPV